jgi:shikimate dehydrogenase
MGIPYAEVIGDPVAQSKSPVIHKFWLEKLEIEGDYRATRVHFNDLADYFATRKSDPDWRGCNITQPHKMAVLELLDSLDSEAVAVGAVNCVYRDNHRLIGTNTDVCGVEAVFDAKLWRANRTTVIGAGGAARAVLEVLRRRNTLEVFMIARDPDSVRPVHAAFARSGSVRSFEDLGVAFGQTEYVINASPLGMEGKPEMPSAILDALSLAADYAVVFDMVYSPPKTGLLVRAEKLGLETANGLEMLVGQARSAFSRFFGEQPLDRDDDILLEKLTS